MGEWSRILGVDPGLRVTGYGVIDSNGAQTRHVANGCIRTEGDELSTRLKLIFDGIGSVVRQYAPAAAAFEKVFVARNADSAIKLGQARSAAICATFAGNVTVHEYAARAVKQAVVGAGGAEKAQVQHMVRALLQLPAVPAADAADALAVALCHAHSHSLASRLAGASRLRVVRR